MTPLIQAMTLKTVLAPMEMSLCPQGLTQILMALHCVTVSILYLSSLFHFTLCDTIWHHMPLMCHQHMLMASSSLYNLFNSFPICQFMQIHVVHPHKGVPQAFVFGTPFARCAPPSCIYFFSILTLELPLLDLCFALVLKGHPYKSVKW